MSGATVDLYVCSTRGRVKGPGTKSRDDGSDGGGGWCGCKGPRSYLGERNWYLPFLIHVRIRNGKKEAHVYIPTAR